MPTDKDSFNVPLYFAYFFIDLQPFLFRHNSINNQKSDRVTMFQELFHCIVPINRFNNIVSLLLKKGSNECSYMFVIFRTSIVSEPPSGAEYISFVLFSTIASLTGRNMLNVVPLPDIVSTLTIPLCCFMIPYTIESPRPLPSPTSFVVKKGSNIISFISLSLYQFRSLYLLLK